MKHSWNRVVSAWQLGANPIVSPAIAEESRGGFRTLGWRFAPALALILALPLAAAAQGNAARVRVTERVDLSRLVTLKGNTHALARAQYDQGAAPADLPMNRIMLVLQRGADQEAALQDLLTQQQINSSPSYHKWLTPDQFGQQFGPADADIQAVTSWLASFGFQNIKVSRGRTTIEFSGTASQVQAALHTPIHRYLVNGVSHVANAKDPQIPAALAPVVAGFASLHNFGHHHTIRNSGVKGTATVKRGERPQLAFTDGSHGMIPADFNTIYNVTASGMTGSGVTIGIVSDSNINVSDVTTFDSMFGLSSTPAPTIVADGPLPDVVPGSTGESEAVLDATWAGAVAPQANVQLVVSADTDASAGSDLSEIYIIDNNSADIMTESFSSCEAQFASAGILTGTGGAGLFYGSLAEQAAAQGITYLVASGDGGPDTCDDQTTIPATDQAASVNILAATPFNVAVGGTELHDCDTLPGCNDTSGTYWQPTNGTNPGAAIKYIPENVWNEACTSTTPTPACPALGLWSSGGGASIEYGGNSGDYPGTPPWQVGVTGLPTGVHARLLPDVALAAGDHDGYVICIDGSCPGTLAVASGTSASVQAFGGIMALVDQKMGGRVGNANYVLYKLAAAETYSNCNGSTVPSPGTLGSCIFNDVTVGNTNIPGEIGFTAGTGYDETTGLGSVNATNLINQWSTIQTAGSNISAFTLNGSTNALSITHGQSVSVAVTVSPTAPATGAPSGDVSLIAGLAASAGTGQGADFFQLTQNGTSSSASGTTKFLPGGNSYIVHAHYSGDGTFLGSDSTGVTVTVNPEASLTLVGVINESSGALCSTTSSVTYGGNYILAAGVVDLAAKNSNGASGPGSPCLPVPSGAFPSGHVAITDNGSPLDAGTFALNSNGFVEDRAVQLTPGAHTIQASYSGDNSFSPTSVNGSSGPATATVTVTKASTASSITSAPTTVAANTAFQLSAMVDTLVGSIGSTGAAPTGTVTFTATTTGSVYPPGGHRPAAPAPLIIIEAAMAIAFLLLLRFANQKRRGLAWLGLAVVTVLAVGTSCGGSSSGGGGGGGSTTLGTVNLTGTTDSSGFVAATATLTNATLSKSATITASYSGDSNYNSSTVSGVTITVQ